MKKEKKMKSHPHFRKIAQILLERTSPLHRHPFSLDLRPPLAALLLLVAVGASAAQSKVLLSASQNLWLGYPDGVKVSSAGVLTEGPAFGKALELPGMPLCAASVGTRLFIGTAPGGDLLKVEGDSVTVLHHFEEPLVMALAAAKDGSLLVGTSTPAKVYRVNPSTGEALLVCAPKADYVWALLFSGPDLLAATGTPGKLLRIPEKGEPETVLDPSAAHVRCLLSWGNAVWAGTSGPASVYRVEGTKAFLAASLKQEEIVALAPCGDGLLLAANEKSDPSAFSKGGKPAGASALCLLKTGRPAQQLEDFQTPVLSLASLGGGCAAGLGDGRIFLCQREEFYLASNWEGASVSVLEASGGGLLALTAGPNSLYRPATGGGARAFLSPVADLGAPARLGKAEVLGTGQGLQFRTGNASKPGPFWTGWTRAEESASLPPAQFAQWKIGLGAGEEVRGVSIAYRPLNRPPVFKSAEVRPPGEVSVRMPSQLGDRLVREVHEKDIVFPGLAQSPSQDIPPQTYYLQGYRMVAWKTEDPDGDEIRVTVEFRPENGNAWYTLAERVSDGYHVFDARALPDGAYRMRLTASDGASNAEGEAAVTTQELPDFLVDNTPPRLTLSPVSPGKLLATATDNTAVLGVRASVDGEPWQAVTPQGWIPGGQKMETTVVYPAAGTHWITVQAVDPFRNLTVEAWLTGEGK